MFCATINISSVASPGRERRILCRNARAARLVGGFVERDAEPDPGADLSGTRLGTEPTEPSLTQLRLTRRLPNSMLLRPLPQRLLIVCGDRRMSGSGARGRAVSHAVCEKKAAVASRSC